MYPRENRPVPLWKQLKARGLTAPGDLLEVFGIIKPPVPVEDIADRLGVPINKVPAPGWSGALTVMNNHAVIWLDLVEAPVRHRFTIAHELGHLMLQETERAHRDTTFDGSPEESAANRFAADLLMPLWMLDDYADAATSPEKVEAIAELFGVSRAAMERRLLELFGVPVPPL